MKPSIFQLSKNTLNISLPKFHINPSRSLFVFSEDNMIRKTAKSIINLNIFEVLIQLTILANCVVLAMEIHYPEGDKSNMNKRLEESELYFLIIFTFEAVLKIIAMGFVLNNNSYLRNQWNVLDFIVILVGIVGSTFSNFDQRVVGALRALRPLKLIYNIESLQIVVQSLFRAMQPLLQIAILILFFILMFSIIGLEFYSGRFHFGCFKNEKANYIEELEPIIKKPCSPSNNTYNAYKCPQGFTCRTYWNGPFEGVINFDNILYSMLTVFQCLTMEGWSDVLYTTNEAMGTPWNYFYYVSLVLIGSFFMLNLVLGVLSGEFAKERERVEKRQKFLQIREDLMIQEEMEGYLDWIETYEEILLNEEELTEDQRQKILRAKERAQKIRRKRSDQESIDYLKHFDIVGNIDKTKKNREVFFCCFSQIGRFRCFSNLAQIRCICRKFIKSQTYFWGVIILVTLNILIVSLEHYNQPSYLETLQMTAEYVFLAIFMFEMILKIFALGIHGYFESKFNVFDILIVIASLFEVVWQYFKPESSFGISAVRAVRILRVFKVTRYWSSMRNLVLSLLNSMRSIFSLLFLMFLFIFIFAILGMQLFGGGYNFDEGKPGQNFDTFFIAILSVFQILTGENWNEAMYNGIKSQRQNSDSWSMLYGLYFILIVVIGNYTLLNVFLAIAVDNLGNAQQMEQMEMEEAEKTELEEPKECLKYIIGKDVEVPPLQVIETDEDENFTQYRFKTIIEELEATCESYKTGNFLPETKLGVPISPYSSLFIFSPKGFLRRVSHFVVNIEHFETFIIIVIIASSLALASEDVVNEDAKINKYFRYFDYTFTGIFATECLIKIIDMGLILHPNAYLRSIWNIIDLLVVISAIVYIQTMTTDRLNKSTIKALRVIRVLRPFKTVQRIPKLKKVFDTVIQSVKNVFNILIVYVMFQFIFAVIAVQLFGGKFFYCNDVSKRQFDSCRGYFIEYADPIVTRKREWKNFCFHFNNVLYALVTLYTVTTSEGWLTVLRHSMDANGINLGPKYYYQGEIAIFYVVFFIVFPFFFVNIFIALIIITFQEEGSKSFSELDLDKNQKLCIDFVVMAQPRIKYVPGNKYPIQCQIWRLVTSTPFEIFILIMIVLNTIVLMMRYYKRDFDPSKVIIESMLHSVVEYSNYHDALQYLNLAFVLLFTLECILKILAFNPKNYFMDSWNVFDFITVLGSITDFLITNIKTEGLVREVPNIGFLRIFRAARLMKLLSQVTGIRIVLWTFIQSLKSLPYVLMLIFMLFFVYCIIGMQLFGDINLDSDTQIHIYNNFQTFFNGMLLLFRCATGENWQEIMLACEEGKLCQCSGRNCVPRKDCGNDISYLYFITFSFATTYLMFNLFIAVLMENFDFLTRDISILGPHHLDEYIDKWSNYDLAATGEIDYTDVYDLLIHMEPPLGFGKNCPYRIAYRKLIRMNMPVVNGKVHFTTTLMALIKEALDIRKRNIIESDIQDMELRWSIAKLWPKFPKDKIHLLVPTEQETSYPNLTIGKIYTCLRIYENWRAFKIATEGRRVKIRWMSTERTNIDIDQISDLERFESRRQSTDHGDRKINPRPAVKRAAIPAGPINVEQLSSMMYQNLACHIRQNFQNVPRPVYIPQALLREDMDSLTTSIDDGLKPSLHLTAIVDEICKTFSLNKSNMLY